MRDLGKDDRTKVCDFFGTEVRPRHGGAGYECLNGARFSVDADPATCAKAPWTCAATVGEIETGLSVFHGGACAAVTRAGNPLAFPTRPGEGPARERPAAHQVGPFFSHLPDRALSPNVTRDSPSTLSKSAF